MCKRWVRTITLSHSPCYSRPTDQYNQTAIVRLSVISFECAPKIQYSPRSIALCPCDEWIESGVDLKLWFAKRLRPSIGREVVAVM